MASLTLAEFISDLEMAAISALASFSAALSIGADSTKSFESAGIAAAVAGVYAFAKATGLSPTIVNPAPGVTNTPAPAIAKQIVTVTRTETPVQVTAGQTTQVPTLSVGG